MDAIEEPRPRNFQEAIAAFQRCITRAGKMYDQQQGRIDRQRQVIEGQKKEILRLRDLCDGASVDWREGIGL